MKFLSTNHGNLRLPAFFPDATLAHVRTLDTQDLKNCKVQGLVVNAYHLYKTKKGELIKKLGGIHRFMNFDKPVITDSGGWQVMSLIHDNPRQGQIAEYEIIFKDPATKQTTIFTPEESIRLQSQLNPDIMICLDDCTRPDMAEIDQEKSVEFTIAWAKRCKKEFVRLTKNEKTRPLLFAVIQGGNSKTLRKKCAAELLIIGFDGFSFGGHPVDIEKKLTHEILQYVADLIPNEFPKYAMGVGKPEDIGACSQMGYTMFDCVIPTREARHKRLYVWNENDKRHPEAEQSRSRRIPSDFYSYLYLNSKLVNDKKPIDETCDCLTCKNYTRAYVYHLLQLQEPAALRLATIHNLRFYSRLMEKLQGL